MDPENVRAGFPPTRHSVIERIRDADPDARREAFGDLIDGYWKPVYKHLRLTWSVDAEEARDVTQAFFADAFQKAWLERYEPEKARFRTFVRLCADRFLMNTRQAASRIKRGGDVQMLPLDFAAAEAEMQRHGLSAAADGEEFFRREFVRTLFDRAVEAVRKEFTESGRHVHLTLFERYDVDPADDVSYGGLAREFGLSEARVTNYLAQVRRSFRARALEALRSLTGTDEEFRREARELFGIEVE